MSEKSYGKRVKVPVDSITKAHTWLPDGALPSGVQNCGCERAGGVYSTVAQDAKMEILAKGWRSRVRFTQLPAGVPPSMIIVTPCKPVMARRHPPIPRATPVYRVFVSPNVAGSIVL